MERPRCAVFVSVMLAKIELESIECFIASMSRKSQFSPLPLRLSLFIAQLFQSGPCFKAKGAQYEVEGRRLVSLAVVAHLLSPRTGWRKILKNSGNALSSNKTALLYRKQWGDFGLSRYREYNQYYYDTFYPLPILTSPSPLSNSTMKYSKTVTSSRRKNRKAHFSAHSEARRKLMSANLSKELQARHGVRSMPLRKDDEVQVVRGLFKTREGKVTACFRKKFVVHVERITREKVNGGSVPVGLQASNLMITKLKMDKDRKAKLEAKAQGKTSKKEDVAMSNVD